MSNPDKKVSRIINDTHIDKITTLCGADALFEGKFTSENPEAGFRLDGNLKGSIEFTKGGIIHIGPDAVVFEGVITADYILIEGKVKAKIVARKILEITGTATVQGEAEYAEALDVHPFAKIKGSVNYTGK